MKALITGSGGLIGSECAKLLCEDGWQVFGVDNDSRRDFFGPDATTSPMVNWLTVTFPCYRHLDIDIRHRSLIRQMIREFKPDFIIHTAGQPSHDRAASIPYIDFDVNAVGTLNILVAARDYCRESPICFTSTNKVYGDRPNTLPRRELEMRYDYASGIDGVDETMSIDQCMHSLFGASKVAADVLCQEFGAYFGMPVGVFRAGCLTGPQHAAVELHGYLAYIVRCAISGREYTIHGHLGKQVRDQIHCRDVARLFVEFFRNPRCGEVYNLGGGRQNSLSILETISRLEVMGYKLNYKYSETNRAGDHVCYISDLSKIRRHFPSWHIEYGLDRILAELVQRNLGQRAAGENQGRE